MAINATKSYKFLHGLEGNPVKFYPDGGSVGSETAMKQDRRTPSRTTRSRVRRRDASEGLAEQAPNAPNYVPDFSENQLRATADAPLSLQSGAGRQYWDEALRLFVNIRADCDAAAERLGYASHEDEGLAAVEYIANKILEAVRGERQQQTTNAKKQSPTGPSEVQWATEARHKSAKRDQPARPAGHSERSKLIGELKQMLRDGKTKSGAVIDPQLAHEIAKHITVLNEEATQPETPQSMQRIRDSLARFFGEASGRQKTKAAAATVVQKPKPAKTEPSRPKNTKTTATRRSVTKPSKRSKRRSRYLR
jgi:hypothetical protein